MDPITQTITQLQKFLTTQSLYCEDEDLDLTDPITPIAVDPITPPELDEEPFAPLAGFYLVDNAQNNN